MGINSDKELKENRVRGGYGQEPKKMATRPCIQREQKYNDDESVELPQEYKQSHIFV